MKRINKIIFSFILLFVCINSLSAGDCASGKAETLKEVSQAKSAGFRINMGGCYKYTFTGDYSTIGPFDDWYSARQVSEIFKTYTYAGDDGKSYKTGRAPLCEGVDQKAYILATVKCTAVLYKDTYTSKKDSYQDTAAGLHTTKSIVYKYKAASSTNAIKCSDYTNKSDCTNNGCTANYDTYPFGIKIFKSCSGSGKKCPSDYPNLVGNYCYKCTSGYSGFDSGTKKCSQEQSCASQYGDDYTKKKVDGKYVCWKKTGHCATGGWSWHSSDDTCYSPWKCDKYNGDGIGPYKLTSDKSKCEWVHCPYEANGENKLKNGRDNYWTLITKDGKKQCTYTKTYTEFEEKKNDLGYKDWQREAIEKDCDNKRIIDHNNHSYQWKTSEKCVCDIKYKYQCPIYECNTEVRTISVCTPKFQNSAGKTAYCLNPNDPFSTSYGSTAKYEVDKSFNARTCASSYSTIDCGYANILIEGAYLNKVYGSGTISDNAVELALRLWGAHSEQAGFHQYGMALKYGSSCSSRFYPRKWNTSVIKNIYRETYKKLMSDYFASLKNIDYFNAKTETGRFNIQCTYTSEFSQIDATLNPSRKAVDMIGIICHKSGESGTVYKQAAGLFFNTLLGNKYMQSHLTELYGGKLAVAPEGAYYKTDASGSYVEVRFNESEFNEAFKTYSRGEVINCASLRTTDPNYKKIAPYCQVQVELYNSSGGVLVGSARMDECVAKTSSCRRRVSTKAICDITNVGQRPAKIKVTNEKSSSSYAVKKYVACANPSKSQILFAYNDDPHAATGVTNINNISDPETNIFNISNYICSGSCGNYNVRNNMKKECPKTGVSYGNVYKSSVKDPSLNCILNMNTMSGKEMYDYSDHFKVNKSICRIYCSDEIEYYIADKVKSTSGRTFKYDIELKVNGTRRSAYPLSSMIKERRTCVSDIFYNHIIPDTTELKKTYGLSDSEVASIGTFNDLFNVLIAKANNEGGRAENINQIIYDLYNCNLYANSAFTNNKVVKPKESKTGNLRDNILAQYGASNNYGLVASGDCVIDVSRGINTCIKEKDVVYNWGAEPDGTRVKINSTSAVATTYNNLTYCSGTDCFKYDKDNDATSYVYPKSTDASRTNRLIGNRTTTKSLKVGSSLTQSKLKQWFGKDSIMIPTNDYVLFEIVTDVDFYNASEFQTTPQNDGVICKGSRAGTFINLDKYLYPISKYAYNKCEKVDDYTSRCAITQEFETVATFYRKNVFDEFASVVANSKKFTCYVDVIRPMPPVNDSVIPTTCSAAPCYEGARYRNVDPANLFPRYTSLPRNWNNTEGRAAKAEIESTASQLKTTDNLLEYRITLTPTQLKNLNDYSGTAPAYQNETVTGCEIKDDYYVNCKSTLLNTMRNDASNKYGTFDPNYKYGISTYTKNKH